ncbi:MAG: 3-isopropylmalate dehydratase small subunit [Kiritimatiellia bacterium]
MKVSGKTYKYGDNVDTDVIIPARYLNTPDAKELAKHCMEDIDTSFASTVKPGEIMIAGKNFGCGSSREHAPLAIKTCGVACVIAATFARIFYRNALNIGLPILECPEAAKAIKAGDTVSVDFDTGVITDETTGKSFQGEPFPPFMQELIAAGGLAAFRRSRG